MNMQMPSILYKYKPINEYTEKIFTEGKLYFPSISELNDPFEGSIPFIFDESELTEENIRKKMYESAKERFPKCTDEQLREYVSENYGKGGFFDKKYLEEINTKTREEINQKFGIFSMTADRNNYLMWSHYADGHKGLCIGFDSDTLRESIGMIGNVGYQNDLPKYKISGDEFDLFKTLLLTKSASWQYEEEYRLLIFERNDKEVSFPFDSIVEVIFGCRMQPEEKEEYKKLVLQKNPNCKIYEATMSKRKFELDFNLITK